MLGYFKNRLRNQLNKKNGYSLPEMFLVILLIGILLTIFGPKIGDMFKRLNRYKITRFLQDWKGKIIQFNLDTGVLPDKLSDLWQRPNGHAGRNWQGYVTKEDQVPPLDPQGMELVYNRPPREFKDLYDNYELYSIGTQDEDKATKETFIHVGG